MLDLLVVQGNTFCNLRCKYCYLTDLDRLNQQSLETLKMLAGRLSASSALGKRLTICWHAGEPLVCGIGFYQEAFDIFKKLADAIGVSISHSLQTNGTLITDAWITFFKTHDVHIGLSIDGPSLAHDAFRVTRSGEGTHAKTLRGLRSLVEANISFGAIAVVGEYALNHPDEFHQFFEDEKVPSVGLNVPEIEGMNRTSIITEDATYAKFKNFIGNLFRLSKRRGTVSYREIENVLDFARSGGTPRRSSTATKGHILNVRHDGKYTTFAPELLSMKDVDGRDFIIGDVRDTPIDQALQSERARELERSIDLGLLACKKSCGLFELCGGGSPSNKLAETGSFKSSETAFCQLSQRAVFEAVRDASA